MKKIIFVNLGKIGYKTALDLQHKLLEHMKSNQDLPGYFLLLEHHPVFTLGRDGGVENLLYSREEIKSRGIDIYETDRGGNITYHGYGQIVGYPVLNLNYFKKDIHWYLNQLEEMIISVLGSNEIVAGRKSKYRGVWVGDKKICAMGIAIRSWITNHGFALNFETNEEHFKLINPCGITDFGVTSIKEIKKDIKKEAILLDIKQAFQSFFECQLHEENFAQIKEMIKIDNE